ncbi:MAG: hypothetical protein ACRC2V_26920 [Xenococcaceae cyanobacterium]
MRKKRTPITAQKWISPKSKPKFKIGDLVVMDAKSTTIPQNSIGRIYGVLYKIDTQFSMSGFWYDIHFEGFIAHHTIGEPLLKGVEK